MFLQKFIGGGVLAFW